MRKSNNGELCPGEDKCRTTPWKPLWKRDEVMTQEICRGCKLVDSKPGNQPRDLAEAISTAIELDQVKECGGTFAYPDGLTPFQWASLKGLNAGRALYQDKEAMRQRKQAQQESDTQRMANRVSTGNPTRPIR